MTGTFYERPILNSPYEEPTLHHALDEEGQPTDDPPVSGRRRSELVTPVPRPRKHRKKANPEQTAMDLHTDDGISSEEQEYNPTPIINEIRSRVADWRRLQGQSDWAVTPATARLLRHWRDHDFQGTRPFFCQIEAVETIIWLTEVARHQKTHKRYWEHIQGANEQANPELIRLAMKMATGAGKTTVMAMLVAWQTVNAVRSPASRQFTRGFLIVTPGITIRDRLRVLQPNDPNSYYKTLELVPADMLEDIALHRTASILRKNSRAKILLTTFSSPLANVLEHKLRLLTGGNGSNVTILPFEGVAHDLFTLAFGHTPRAASGEQINRALESAADDLGVTEFTPRFLVSEWNNIVDAWQIDSLDAYRDVPRLGRKNRVGSKQRERIWPVFARARNLLEAQGVHSWPGIFGKVTAQFTGREHKPFSNIIVDEAQDLGVPELRMFAAIADRNADALFFAGDLGQRIFKEPFSWKVLGVDIRGRSHALKVNYRTSHQIRQTVDRLLPPLVRDADGNDEDRRGTVSVFNGPDPLIRVFGDRDREIEGLAHWVCESMEHGVESEEIGIFVRSIDELSRARAVVRQASQTPLELSERVEDRNGRISIGTMHFAKGLEFKAVAVMACDDDVLPLQQRIETVADETELDEVYETERHLFYVACTRARDQLLVSGVEPASEFFADLSTKLKAAE